MFNHAVENSTESDALNTTGIQFTFVDDFQRLGEAISAAQWRLARCSRAHSQRTRIGEVLNTPLLLVRFC
ncbi:hypothetical protein OH492_07045 [Vibrio chagasii]|nr:hypothetical protein [Vibrio chagasii]